VGGASRVGDSLRCLVRFTQLNLMNEWPPHALFDVIFCRNVMLYFDRDTQERMVRRFTQALRPGGFLLIGHAETLSGIDHPLRYVQPAVYIK
jgi:chemotaxis protein methyltransferase CheR